MSAYFTVVQYVPDPVANERINIGVIAVGDGIIEARFLEKWNRVRSFAGADLAYLQEFAARVADATATQMMQLPMLELPDKRILTEELLAGMVDGWTRSIQLTPPRGSLESRSDLLDEAVIRFLREPIPRRHQFRGRDDAANIAVNAVEVALKDRVGPRATHVLRRKSRVVGKVIDHEIDAVARNGNLYYAVHSLSFENPTASDMEKDLQSTIWAVSDIKEIYPSLPFGVLTLRPPSSQSRFETAVSAMKHLNASVLMEDEIDDWAREQSQHVPLEV